VHDAPTGLELDGLQCARALAGPLRGQAPDLLLFGKLAIDDQAAQVGTLVAAELGMPCIGEVIKMEWAGERIRLHHLVDGRIEVVEAALPVAATAQKGLNEPRYPGIKGIMAAKKKPLESVPAEPGPPSLTMLRIDPPPPRQPGRIVGQGAAAVEPLLELLRNEAKVI
jgi:electron transfer flavoprotein beta subunit